MGRKKNGPKKKEKKEQNASSFGSPPPPYSHLPPPSSSRSFKMEALLQHHGLFSSSPLGRPFPSRGETQLEHVSRNINSWETPPTTSKNESTEHTISHLTKHGTTADRPTIFPFLLFPSSPSCPIFPYLLTNWGPGKEEGGGAASEVRRALRWILSPHIGPTYPFPPSPPIGHSPPPSYSSTRHHQAGRGRKKKTPHCTYTHRTAATNNNTVYTSCTFLGCAVWTDVRKEHGSRRSLQKHTLALLFAIHFFHCMQ